MQDLIAVVKRAAAAKGWETSIAAQDKKDYRYATVAVSRPIAGRTFEQVTGNYEITCDSRIAIKYHQTSFHNYGLSDLYDAVGNEFWRLPWVGKKPEPSKDKNPEKQSSPITLEVLLRRFHTIAKQLKNRHEDRETLTIADEYDVQDLLRALLHGLFEDVRPEEYSPSYAGASSRLDFLLKREQVVVEAKMASSKLRDKQIGEQLIVDIKRYQKHPDCKRLICFVYDPGGFLKNPGGLEGDLSGIHDKLEVKVVVVSL